MGAAGEVIGRSLVSSPPSELHVLAVDDSLVDRKVIEKLLKTFSCKVTAVDSGRRALQFLGLLDGDQNKLGYDHVTQALKPVVNLIMTDYSMPEMTGYDLLKKIKGSSACRDIPVVIMSSETILARIDRCLEEGAEEFLEKPVKLSDIERLTRILLSRDPEDEDEDEDEVEVEVEVEVEDNNSTRKRTVLQTDDDDDETATNNNKRLKIIHKKC